MEIEIQTGEELNLLLEALLDEIVKANSYYRLVSGLENAVPDYEWEFRQAGVFWHLTQKALKDACLISLCRIYEQNSETLNLFNLLHTIKGNLHFFSEQNFRERFKNNAFVDSLAVGKGTPEIHELESDIESVSCRNLTVKKLMIWRGNIIAHHNANLALGKNKVLEDKPLVEPEIKQLLEQSVKIFNKYSSLYGNPIQNDELFINGQDDYKSLLLSLKRRVHLSNPAGADLASA